MHIMQAKLTIGQKSSYVEAYGPWLKAFTALKNDEAQPTLSKE